MAKNNSTATPETKPQLSENETQIGAVQCHETAGERDSEGLRGIGCRGLGGGLCGAAAVGGRASLASAGPCCPLDISHGPDNLALNIEEAIDRREENEEIGAGQDRDVDGEPVVVAEFQFLDRDGIVLVDNRHDVPGGEQALEGVPGVAAAHLAVEIAVGEQELRDVQLVARKSRLIGAHELRLADRGTGLRGREIVRPHGQGKGAHARRDGAAGDHDALMTGADKRGHLGAQPSELFQIKPGRSRPGENAGTTFEDDAFFACSHNNSTEFVRQGPA